tara:strand:+ start:395 stop:715 length:321 start_codon:yes stop_codon:yes gene_type:complete
MYPVFQVVDGEQVESLMLPQIMTLPWWVKASIRANLRIFSSEDKLEDIRLLEIRFEKLGVARENNIAAIDKVIKSSRAVRPEFCLMTLDFALCPFLLKSMFITRPS